MPQTECSPPISGQHPTVSNAPIRCVGGQTHDSWSANPFGGCRALSNSSQLSRSSILHQKLVCQIGSSRRVTRGRPLFSHWAHFSSVLCARQNASSSLRSRKCGQISRVLSTLNTSRNWCQTLQVSTSGETCPCKEVRLFHFALLHLSLLQARSPSRLRYSCTTESARFLPFLSTCSLRTLHPSKDTK